MKKITIISTIIINVTIVAALNHGYQSCHHQPLSLNIIKAFFNFPTHQKYRLIRNVQQQQQQNTRVTRLLYT